MITLKNRIKIDLADLDTIRRSVEMEAKIRPLSERSMKLSSLAGQLLFINKNNQLKEFCENSEFTLLQSELIKNFLLINKVRICLKIESYSKPKTKRSARIANLSLRLEKLLKKSVCSLDPGIHNWDFDQLGLPESRNTDDPFYHFCKKCQLTIFE